MTKENVIKKVLKKVGVQPQLLGYEYSLEAVQLVMEDRGYLQGITGKLYPILAKKFQTKPSRVERAIRHAIESAMDIISPDVMSDVFGNTINPKKGKPSNAHFIAAIAETVKEEWSENDD